MKSKKLVSLFMISVLLSGNILGCSAENKKQKEEDGFLVYYVDENRNKLMSCCYELVDNDTKEQVREVWRELKEDREDGKSAIPENVELEGVSIYNSEVFLYFNTFYNNMDSITEILARASIVLTMTQIEGVDSVNIYVGKKPLRDANDKTVGSINATNFVDAVGMTVNKYETTTVTLYFANVWGNSLRTETRTGMYDSSKSLEEYIVLQLLEGPSNSGNYGTIPAKTKLISVNTSEGVCYVDFSSEFLQSAASVKDEILIYSIVNSLTELSYINKVQITVEGENDITLHGDITLDTLFTKNLSVMED